MSKTNSSEVCSPALTLPERQSALSEVQAQITELLRLYTTRTGDTFNAEDFEETLSTIFEICGERFKEPSRTSKFKESILTMYFTTVLNAYDFATTIQGAALAHFIKREYHNLQTMVKKSRGGSLSENTKKILYNILYRASLKIENYAEAAVYLHQLIALDTECTIIKDKLYETYHKMADKISYFQIPGIETQFIRFANQVFKSDMSDSSDSLAERVDLPLVLREMEPKPALPMNAGLLQFLLKQDIECTIARHNIELLSGINSYSPPRSPIEINIPPNTADKAIFTTYLIQELRAINNLMTQYTSKTAYPDKTKLVDTRVLANLDMVKVYFQHQERYIYEKLILQHEVQNRTLCEALETEALWRTSAETPALLARIAASKPAKISIPENHHQVLKQIFSSSTINLTDNSIIKIKGHATDTLTMSKILETFCAVMGERSFNCSFFDNEFTSANLSLDDYTELLEASRMDQDASAMCTCTESLPSRPRILSFTARGFADYDPPRSPSFVSREVASSFADREFLDHPRSASFVSREFARSLEDMEKPCQMM